MTTIADAARGRNRARHLQACGRKAVRGSGIWPGIQTGAWAKSAGLRGGFALGGRAWRL
ncbi:MAG: hypothetical protein ACJAVR_001377 [Paracoccaceae bacterium]|jgi:hypothetical protein